MRTQRFFSSRFCARTAALAALLFVAPAQAICDQTGASDEDLALRALVEPFCPVNYFTWHADVYNCRSEAWSGRGYFDACNVNTEYTKHWLATLLMRETINDVPVVATHTDGTMIFLDGSFNSGKKDYGALTQGEAPSVCSAVTRSRSNPSGRECREVWHREYFNVVDDARTVNGSALAGQFIADFVDHDVTSQLFPVIGLFREIFEGEDILFTTCPLYSPGPANEELVYRAGNARPRSVACAFAHGRRRGERARAKRLRTTTGP
jgi:hypothetical protein